MNLRPLLVVMPLLAQALVACGPSTCQRSSDVSASLRGKVGDCQGVTFTDHKATCEANISKCTADDLKKVDDMNSCLEKVPACVKGQELAWAGQLAGCVPQGLSDGCKNAFP